MADDFELKTSPLSQAISSGEQTVHIHIYGDGEGKWILEIEYEFGNSTVWDDHFATDRVALIEAKKSILGEGVNTFVGPDDGKSNEDWK